MLEGGGLPAIARVVAVDLGCQVAVYGADGSLVAAHSGRNLSADVPSTMPVRQPTGRTTVALPGGGESDAWVRPV